MARAPSAQVHRLAAYYFFMRCKDHPRVVAEFAICMPEELKATSTKPIDSNWSSAPGGTDTSRATRSSKKTSPNDFLEKSMKAITDIAAAVLKKETRQ
jgi:hypothetical protein